VVAAVGEGVGHVAVGDRVVAACGRTLAERVAAKAPLVIPAPRALGFEAAAGICITYFTTMYALKQRRSCRPARRCSCSAPRAASARPRSNSASRWARP